ncbi:DUF3107 domain-containing protein [Brevibacterium litoralis]|uniref:DUF3107 domain-containing protein n=1 Tax=Brevibacterium litoralis TaxID=3138935 RepID=UPI0032F02136
MEIKIGVRQAPRELTIEVESTAAEVATQVDEAIEKGSVLSFTDDKGRQVMVPASALAYVETGTENHRPVGFGLV